MKPSRLFAEEDRKLVEDAIAQAEKTTAGEIVPVVAAASGRYDRAEDIVGLIAALILVSAAWIFLQDIAPARGAWRSGPAPVLGLWRVLSLFVAGFAGGAAAATYWPGLKMPFVPKEEIEEEVGRSAAAAFSRLGAGRTREGTGIVIYVSLLERRVRVEGSGAASERISQQDWERVCRLATDGLRGGRAAQGLAEAVRAAGEVLAGRFPVRPDDKNELTDKLHLIDQSP